MLCELDFNLKILTKIRNTVFTSLLKNYVPIYYTYIWLHVTHGLNIIL